MTEERMTALEPQPILPFLETLHRQGNMIFDWFLTNVMATEIIIQVALTAIAIFASFLLSKQWERKTQEHLHTLFRSDRQKVLRDSLTSVLFPLVWLVAQSVMIVISQRLGWPVHLLNIVSVLVFAWIVIRLSTGFVHNPFWSKLIAVTAWGFAALNVLDLFAPTIAFLDGLAFSLGKFHISLLEVLKAVAMLSLFIWLATTTSRTVERKIRSSPTLTPSMKELFVKLLKFVLITTAVLMSLTSVGIDLTTLAFFSGAIGVGIGFGLQKIVSNLISGIILLLDRSIKPGDVIELDDTYGWVNALSARFVSVITRDGKEHLIPNEDMITQKVINWSYSDTNVRQKIPMRISYESDLHKAMDLLVEAAMETPRVLESPAPRCLLIGFSDSAIELELRIWSCDPNNGVANLKSAVMLKAYDKFKENGVEFASSQQNVHLDIKEETLAALIGNKQTTEKAITKPHRPATSKARAKPPTKKKK